jgi:hypothetical protein
MKPRILATILYLSAAVAIVFLPSSTRMLYGGETPAVLLDLRLVSPAIFALAAIALFYRPRFGHFLALCGGLFALPWFTWTEISWPQIFNSWIALNLVEKRDTNSIRFSELKILATGLTITALACSVVRLLPDRWTFRGTPFSDRTWPAITVCFVIFTVWFGSDVMPYRLPGMISRGFPVQLEMLHIEKKGLQFHEVGITLSGFGEKYEIRENNRRLFQYEFKQSYSEGQLPARIARNVTELIQSGQLKNLHTPPARPLRAWNSEGWYFVGLGDSISAFTDENEAQAPKEVTDVFQDIETVAPSWRSEGIVRDVCLGFCFDPVSGLGHIYANERCSMSVDGITHCQ